MMENSNKDKQRRAVSRPMPCRSDVAVEETLRLYHAWLGYLLRRLGQEEVRVPAEEVRQALDHMSCRVWRDGGDYMISFANSKIRAGEEGAGGAAEQRAGV